MLSLLKKPEVTVEQIHAEFDSAQERLLRESHEILGTLSIEKQMENKCNDLMKLGFVKSEGVTKIQEIQEKRIPMETLARTIQYFKLKYPFDKFITVDELERICKKYNLIHAPVSQYIKDVPEKNVLEMKNSKKLDEKDKSPANEYLFRAKSFHKTSTQKHLLKGKTFTMYLNEAQENTILRNDFSSDTLVAKLLGLDPPIKNKTTLYYEAELIKVDKSGLFIAAPKSHFDLNGLSKRSPFGFFNIQTSELKDPVVFEYCRDNICRILTKWGTDDDQSYLDPSLLNETLN
jgi:hypothetical protein